MRLLLAMPGGAEWMILLLVFGIMLIPTIFYLITLQSTLLAISIPNRKMEAGSVWYLLIPLFGTIWHFNVVKKMAESIYEESNLKNIKIDETKPAYNIGLAMCILNCCNLIPGLNVISGLASLICWIIYWNKISNYKAKLLFAPINN